MASEKEEMNLKVKIVGVVQDLMKVVEKGARQFVAFVFLVFTAGMLFALYIANVEPLLLFVPPLLGLVAFYNEKISYLLLAGIVIFIFV